MRRGTRLTKFLARALEKKCSEYLPAARYVLDCVLICLTFYFVQDAGSIIGKGGSNIKRLRQQVRGVTFCVCLHIIFEVQVD